MDTTLGCHTLSQAGLSKAANRDLERISIAADRAAVLKARLAGFLSRWHGMEKEGGGSDQPVRSGYRGALDDLFDRLDELENITIELTSLG